MPVSKLNRIFLSLLTVLFLTPLSVDAQFISSGTGSGKREGTQGLVGVDGFAQGIGYANSDAMDDAAEQGYGQNNEDGAAWTAATSGIYDEDCQARLGKDCADATADEFRPLIEEINEAIDEGYSTLTEQGEFTSASASAGGDDDDAINCKNRGFAATVSDMQTCIMADDDDMNEGACQALAARDGLTGVSDCGDLTEEDYSEVLSNRPPTIRVPADWTTPVLEVGAGAGTDVMRVYATDPDNDPLSWSLTDNDGGTFAISGNGQLSLLAALQEAGQDNLNVRVRVSDGLAFDEENFAFSVVQTNRPPQIILPADWGPSPIAEDAQPGDSLITQLAGVDPDGDPLTWSILSSGNLLTIDANSGVISLSADAIASLEDNRPDSVSFTVTLSDGTLSDEQSLSMAIDENALLANRPPQIILPADWGPSPIAEDAQPGDSLITQLAGVDPDGDALTWSITSSNDILTIDANSGVVSLSADAIASLEDNRPDTVSFTVTLSDGSLNDEQSLTMAIDENALLANRPPVIFAPMDWVPSPISNRAEAGDRIISALGANDPDGDELTWSIASMEYDVFVINPTNGHVSLAGDEESGTAIPSTRPDKITLTVQVSDGSLTDEMDLTVSLEAANRPPKITVPQGFGEQEYAPYAGTNTAVGALSGSDPDGDKLTWSFISSDPEMFTINPTTGVITYSGLGEGDKLNCVAPQTASSQSQAAPKAGTSSYGVASVNGFVTQDHNRTDFRSKKQGGTPIRTGKYNVTLERANHRGGTFVTESRAAKYYPTSNGSIQAPAVASASVNSNVTPINSYVVFQNNSQIDLSAKEAVITFNNPIVGIYYTDYGFDKTIGPLGKPGGIYSRKSQQNKMALENDRDIAWIDAVDRRRLHFRSRTANIGDFLRVITTASNDVGGPTDPVEPTGPDECSASLTVQLSDGQLTDEETVTLSFGDPNRAPRIFAPMDWVPQMVSNSKGVGDLVISALGANDPDGDALQWSLTGDDAALFTISKVNGKMSLSQNYGSTQSLPSKAEVTVKVTDGRLSDTMVLNIPIEQKEPELTMAADSGVNGKFQFVSDKVQNIFNQDYTIMARFYHGGSGGYGSRYYQWWPKRGWKTSPAKETIFFYGGNDNVGRKVSSGISLHVYDNSIRLQLGTDYNYLETRTALAKNRWHTVMFTVDADQRTRTGNKANWPIKIFLNGRRLGTSEFKTASKNRNYAPIVNSPFAAIGIAGRWKEQNDSRRPWARHLPLRSSSFIHEVSIWQGNKSGSASAIYNNNRDVQDYAATSAGKPRYSWKPALWGKSTTGNGQATLTLANLANGSASNGGPLAGNGSSRLDGDMHLYPGRFTVSNGAAKAYTVWQGRSPRDIWHQGMNYYFDLLKSNGQRNWQSGYRATDRNDVETFTNGEKIGNSRSLGQ